jgi:hypothetical protein
MGLSIGQTTLGGVYWPPEGSQRHHLKFRHGSERDVMIKMARDRVCAYFEPLGLDRRFVVTQIGKEPWPPVGDPGNPL